MAAARAEFTSAYTQVTARRKNGTPTATKTWPAGYVGPVPRPLLEEAVAAGAAREVDEDGKPVKAKKPEAPGDGG